MTEAISVQNLSFYYDTTKILDDITFTVPQGGFLGIIGPNGGGKTTLLRLLLGFYHPTKGSIRIFGKDPKNARKDMAYVPQTLRFDAQFPISVKEVVLGGMLSSLNWWGGYKKQSQEQALKALEQVGMEDFANHQFGTLSSGQAQRVLIARALVSKPKLLLLDEPTACVDVQSEHSIHKILNALPKEITIVMVTHDLPTIVEDVNQVLAVHGKGSLMDPKQVCEHFSLGLYHSHTNHEGCR